MIDQLGDTQMTRRLLWVLLWAALLPLVGCGRLVWRLLGALAGLSPKVLLLAVGLVVALSLPSPMRDLLAEAGVWPLGHETLRRVLAVGSIGVLYHGLRAPSMRRLVRQVARSGGQHRHSIRGGQMLSTTDSRIRR